MYNEQQPQVTSKRIYKIKKSSRQSWRDKQLENMHYHPANATIQAHILPSNLVRKSHSHVHFHERMDRFGLIQCSPAIR